MKCVKVAYPNAKRAGQAIRRLYRSDGKFRRSYKCRKCGQFHLTSQTIRGKPNA